MPISHKEVTLSFLRLSASGKVGATEQKHGVLIVTMRLPKTDTAHPLNSNEYN
jgi:hypothetical protein